MSVFNPESESSRSDHERERTRESRETKEGEKDPELQAAARLERAEYLVKEVKSSKKQMQNILRHVQEVKTLIQQLRTQLQLVVSDDDDSSVVQDKKVVEDLRKKIASYKSELHQMKDDLIRIQAEEFRKQGMVENAYKRAEEMVERMLASVVEE